MATTAVAMAASSSSRLAEAKPARAPAPVKPSSPPEPAEPAQPPQPAQPAQPAGDPNSAAEFLVPPGGGAFEVPIHVGAVCILSFPEEVVASAVVSSPALEVNAWGTDGVAVRASGKATSATLALSTSSGRAKVNVTFRVVAASQPALTLVRFKAASLEEAFNAKVAAEVAKRVDPLLAEMARTKAAMAETLRDRTDELVTERMLKRSVVTELSLHERSSDHVILHVKRAAILGEDGYLAFELENRSGSVFRIARVTVMLNGKDVAGVVRLAQTSPDKDPSVLGAVAPGATARGVVMLRDVAQLTRKPVTLEVADLKGQRKLGFDLGVAFR